MSKRSLAAVWLWWAPPEVEVQRTEQQPKVTAQFELDEERARVERPEHVETPREKVDRLLAGTDVRRLVL